MCARRKEDLDFPGNFFCFYNVYLSYFVYRVSYCLYPRVSTQTISLFTFPIKDIQKKCFAAFFCGSLYPFSHF